MELLNSFLERMVVEAKSGNVKATEALINWKNRNSVNKTSLHMAAFKGKYLINLICCKRYYLPEHLIVLLQATSVS